MDEILNILTEDARITHKEIADLTGRSLAEVKATIKGYEEEGVIVKYSTLINKDVANGHGSFVRALIEVSVAPQKDVGFDKIAERIYNFPEVQSCYLVSGDYDFLVEIEGENILTVSNFVASKLSPMEGVRRTSTHFILRKFKEDGQVLVCKEKDKRLSISF